VFDHPAWGMIMHFGCWANLHKHGSHHHKSMSLAIALSRAVAKTNACDVLFRRCLC
jgi:hypothetical protein